MNDRHDLDGQRLYRPGEPDVWLVYHGRRHWIASPVVFDALFADAEGLSADLDPDTVPEGLPLEDGACLITADKGVGLYLLARGEAGVVRRHLVLNWESWCDFRFDVKRVVTIPKLAMEGIPKGRGLSTQNGRRLVP